MMFARPRWRKLRLIPDLSLEDPREATSAEGLRAEHHTGRSLGRFGRCGWTRAAWAGVRRMLLREFCRFPGAGSGPFQQECLLAAVLRLASGELEFLARFREAAELGEEVAAHAGE